MPAKTRFSLLIDLELLARLRSMKARTGLSDAEQIRRAIRMWLESNEWPARSQTAPAHAEGEFD